MSDQVKIIECPRDAWQGLPKNMPAEVKADYLRVLVAAGFKHIDAVSFVSRSAVPQMADSELVLEYLDPPDDVEIIGIVVNAKGAERAVKTGSVQTLGFPYSVSPTFLQRNQNQTPEESLEELERLARWRIRRGWMWSRISRWRLGILMARPGISMRWWRRAICWRITA